MSEERGSKEIEGCDMIERVGWGRSGGVFLSKRGCICCEYRMRWCNREEVWWGGM